MAGKRVVLLALDGSSNAEYALNWYLGKFWREGDELVGYMAYQPPRLPTFSLKAPFQPPTDEWAKIMEETLAEVRKVEDNFTSVCQAKKLPYKFIDEQNNKPGEGIVSAGQNNNADLIVMGTRGLSTLRRTVLGSVSDYVLHHTGIPVAVVPKPEEQAAQSSAQ